MAKSQATWSKKEREKKKQKEKQEKEERRKERKENARNGNSLDEMMAYIDEYGNISSTPPDPQRKAEVKLEDIVIGVPKRLDSDSDIVEREGTVSFFNEDRGFGFIIDKRSGERIFVHVSGLQEPVKENSPVLFEIEQGRKGPSAVKVRLIK